MAPKTKLTHVHTFMIDNETFHVEFEDKRTFNSFVNAFDKAKSIKRESKVEEPTETATEIDVITPQQFDDFTICDENGHVSLKPPKDYVHNKGDYYTLEPTIMVHWTPQFTGKYWNDGKIHFFPKKTKLSTEFSNEDIANNLKLMGAK